MASSATTSPVPLNYLRLKERIARSQQHRITHSHLVAQQGSRIRPIYVKKKRSMARARSNHNGSSSNGRRTNVHSSSRISKSSNRPNNRYLSNSHCGLRNHQIHDNSNNIGRAYSTTFVSLDHSLYNNIQGDKNSALSPSSTPFLVSIEDTSSPSQLTTKKKHSGVVDFQDSQGHGSSRIEFGSSETFSSSPWSSEEAQEMMLLKREAYRELASQTQRFDELFIAKMIHWEGLGLEEKSRWLEQGGHHGEDVEEEEEDEDDEFEDDMEDGEEQRRSQHNNYYHRPATTHRRVCREERDEMDDLVTALECRATVKDYSALLAFEKQQAQLRHGPNHTHIHGLLPQDQDVLW
ncbi:hypothetical protein BGZ93_009819 [Podila epicladia]|nr:hypothetical protein BGZ92_006936 [Podila epicladia]KAG0098936.1 hypothetical protein BGZ93_009819 [Podila epicladia]